MLAFTGPSGHFTKLGWIWFGMAARPDIKRGFN